MRLWFIPHSQTRLGSISGIRYCARNTTYAVLAKPRLVDLISVVEPIDDVSKLGNLLDAFTEQPDPLLSSLSAAVDAS